MSLQMVDVDQRNAQGAGEALGEAHSHKQRPHEAGTTGERHSRELPFVHSRLLQRLVYHWHDVLLMGT